MKRTSSTIKGMRNVNKSFTLIELLVILSITSILLVMLVTALKQVRVKVQTISCASNLGQMGKALIMYTSDNDGDLPSGDWGEKAWWWGIDQPNSVMSYLGDDLDTITCPSDPNALYNTNRLNIPNPEEWWSIMRVSSRDDMSYGYNGVISKKSGQKISQAKRLSEKVGFADSGHSFSKDPYREPERGTQDAYLIHGWGDKYRIFERHENGANILFLDGGVRFTESSVLDIEYTTPTSDLNKKHWYLKETI